MLMWVGVGWARGASELTGRTGTLNTEASSSKEKINRSTRIRVALRVLYATLPGSDMSGSLPCCKGNSC